MTRIVLSALRNRLGNTEELFDSQHISKIIMHRRQIIEAVRQRQNLMIGPVFGEFFYAPVQKANMRGCLDNSFAVKFKDQLQNSVRGGVLRTHVNCHGFGRCHRVPLQSKLRSAED